MPRADEYYANGLEYQTQHLKIEGEQPVTNALLFIPLSAGVDFWIGGLNVDSGFEDAGDQAPDDERPLVTDLPATYEVLDGVMTGEMSAEEYAEWVVPRILEDIRDHPRYEMVKENAIETYNERVEKMDEDRRQKGLEQFEERTGIEMEDPYLTEEKFDEFSTQLAERVVKEQVYPGLKDQLTSLAGMTPEDFTFSEGAIHTEKFLKALQVMKDVQENGDEEDWEKVQSHLAPLFDEGESGTTTAAEVNEAFGNIVELAEDGEVGSDAIFMGDLGIGIFWAGFLWPGETHHMYYKQVTFPLPINVPGIPLERQTITFTFGEADGGDYHETDLRLDPIALPMTLPFLQSPLAAGAASDKEMTVSNVVLNLGFEPGQANVQFGEPADWEMGSSSQSLTLGAMDYQVVSTDTEVPDRSSVGTEVLSTHIDSYDVDENEHHIDNGGFGDSALNNENQVLQDFLGGDVSLLFNTERFITTGPLDVILVEEPNAGDALGATADTYDAANDAREAAPGGDAEDGTPAEPVADDPEEGTEATVNALLDELVPQIRAIREDARSAAEDAVGEDAIDLAEGTPLVDADVDQEIREEEDRRLDIAAPDLNTWDERVYQDGTAVTTVSTGDELADELKDRIEALQSASSVEDLVAATPSVISIPNNAAGFGGATMAFDTGSGTVQVPVEIVIDVLAELGVGVVQDGDGFASMPLIHSPAEKVLAGSSDSGEVSLSGELGSFSSQPVLAIPNADSTARATFDQDVSGAAHSPDLAAGTAEVAGGAGSGVDAFIDGTQSLLADSTSQSAADSLEEAAALAEDSAAVTQESVLNNVAWQYQHELQAADDAASELEENPFAVEAHADNSVELADETAGASATVVKAGSPAIGSDTLGISTTQNVQGFDVTTYTHGEATVFGPDAQSSASDYTGAFAEASSDAGFAFGVDVGGNLVDYPSTFGE